MKKKDIIRAWRDEDYEDSLTQEELAALPANPAGCIVVAEIDIRSVSGGGLPACTETRSPPYANANCTCC